MITEEYRRLNEEQHKTDRNYGTSGWKNAPMVLQLLRELQAASVLDYGCGKGALKNALPNSVDVREYDPAIPGKDSQPCNADIVVCADVMEHVEEQHVTGVIDHVGRLAHKAAYFVISLAEGTRTLPDGSLCHRTVKPVDWWVERLCAIGQVERLKPTSASRDEYVCVVYVGG